MKKPLSFAALLVFTCGCSTMNNTEAGAVGGGIFGGILGTFVGIATGHPLEGAAIGAAAGAGTGALVGHAEDRDDKRRARAAAYALQHPALPIDEVVRMSQNPQISDAIIVNQINATGSVYQLSTADLEFLKQNGVRDSVIIHMQSRRPGMVQFAPPPGQVVIIDPGPPPPVVGIGFGVGRRW